GGESVAEVAAEPVADVPGIGLGEARLGERLVVPEVGVQVPVLGVGDVGRALVEQGGGGAGTVLRAAQAGDRGRPLPARVGGTQVGVGRLQGLRFPLVRLPAVRGVTYGPAEFGDVGGVLPALARLLVQVVQDVPRDRPQAVLGRVLRLGHVVHL